MIANNYLIWGQDSYLVEEKIADIISQINLQCGEAGEIISLDADEISAPQLAETLEFAPLFSLTRIIIFKRPFWLAKSKRKNNRSEEIARVWNNYLKAAPGEQFIIMTAPEYAASNAVIKTFGKSLQVTECQSLQPLQLKKWASDHFSAGGVKADDKVLSLLAASGQDMYYLKNLIEKTCLIAAGGKITQHLDEDLAKTANTTIFKITDELFKRNARTAIANLHKYVDQEQPLVVALFMIVRQFISFSKVKYYKEKGYTSKEIADYTKLQGFQIRNMEKYSNNFSDAELKAVFAACLQADIDIKRTAKDNLMVIENLIYEICL